MGLLLAQGYTLISLAALPAAVVVCGSWLRGFKENGPQSAGAGLAAMMVLGTIGVFAVNALVAGLVAFFAPSTRPSWPNYGIAVAVLTVVPLCLRAFLNLKSR